MLFLSKSTLLAVLLVPAVVEGSGLRRLAEDDMDHADGAMHSADTTLSKIEGRGKLLCGMQDSAGFANFREDGTYDGLEVDLVSDPKTYRYITHSVPVHHCS